MEWLFDPIRVAVSSNNAVEALKLLQKGADPNLITPQRLPLLHCAVQQRSIVMAQLLLQYGANPNARGAAGETALHHAFSGPTEAHQITYDLIQRGADPLIKDHNGVTPIDMARRKRDPVILKLLSNALEKLAGPCLGRLPKARSSRQRQEIHQVRRNSEDTTGPNEGANPAEKKRDGGRKLKKKTHSEHKLQEDKENRNPNLELERSNLKTDSVIESEFKEYNAKLITVLKKPVSGENLQSTKVSFTIGEDISQSDESTGDYQNKQPKRNFIDASLSKAGNKIAKTASIDDVKTIRRPSKKQVEPKAQIGKQECQQQRMKVNVHERKKRSAKHYSKRKEDRPFTPLPQFDIFRKDFTPENTDVEDVDYLPLPTPSTPLFPGNRWYSPFSGILPVPFPPVSLPTGNGLLFPPDQEFLRSILSLPKPVDNTQKPYGNWKTRSFPRKIPPRGLARLSHYQEIGQIEKYVTDILYAYAKFVKGCFHTFKLIRFGGIGDEDSVHSHDITLKKMGVMEARRKYCKLDKMYDTIGETLLEDVKNYQSFMDLRVDIIIRIARKITEDSLTMMNAADMTEKVVESETLRSNDQFRVWLGEHISSLERHSQEAARQFMVAHEKLLLNIMTEHIERSDLGAEPRQYAGRMLREVSACVQQKRSIIVTGFTYVHSPEPNFRVKCLPRDGVQGAEDFF